MSLNTEALSRKLVVPPCLLLPEQEALFHIYAMAFSHSLGGGRDLDQFHPLSRPLWAVQEQSKSSLAANESLSPQLVSLLFPRAAHCRCHGQDQTWIMYLQSQCAGQST